MRRLLAFNILAILVHELLRFGVVTMTGEITGKPPTDELGVWLSMLAVSFIMAVGQRARHLRKLLKLSIVGFVLYRGFTLPKDAPAGGWTVLTNMGGAPSVFEESILMRLVAVMVQIPDAVAQIPSIVDADLAWLIKFIPAGAAEVLTAARSNLKSALETAVASIPWSRFIFTLMDVAGMMFFFKLIRVTTRVSVVLPGALSPGAWIRYLKANGYSLVKNLPMVKKEIAKEQAKLRKDLNTELKSRSRGIEMVRDHDNLQGTSHTRHTPGADMSIPSDGRKQAADITNDSDKTVGNEDAAAEIEMNLNRTLPASGHHASDLLLLMRRETEKENTIWQEGKVSGAVYHGEKQHQDLLNTAFSFYSLSNPLHPDIWPSAMKFESEVISMTANLMNGGESIEGTEICGCTSSGGTESIILAIKAARDYYRDHKGIGRHGKGKRGEVIACVSAHAAVNKACDMMGLKLVHVGYDERSKNPYQVDVSKVRAAVTPRTILIYSSAPSFPHGVIDPIAELGKIASRLDIALHVDACLGGFVLPFARDQARSLKLEAAKKEKAGDPHGAGALLAEAAKYDVPPFDFSVTGVTSMSVDTHKFGYSLKGTSVVLYRREAMRQAQYFCYPEWSGGMYTTPTIAGSRSGGLIAQCWTSMMSLGYKGYMQNATAILKTTKELATQVKAIPGVKLLGNYEAMIVCFASSDPTVNTYSLADSMTKRGWSLNTLQNPPCVHLCVTVCHIGKNALFLKDLKDALEECREAVRRGDKASGKAAIYGMASTLPSGPVEELLKCYNDAILSV